MKSITESGINEREISLNRIVSKIYSETDPNRMFNKIIQDDDSIKLKNLIKGPFLGIFIGSILGINILISEIIFHFQF